MTGGGKRRKKKKPEARLAKSVRMITEQKHSSVHNALKATRFTSEKCRELKKKKKKTNPNQKWKRGYFTKLIFN